MCYLLNYDKLKPNVKGRSRMLFRNNILKPWSEIQVCWSCLEWKVKQLSFVGLGLL